ncbi:hypothetical protein KQX54_012150 [Cotesia glomerata]|uniref:Uncharacterized protein n=1 Tax=Cotesia glomerata TaxID=32391 RepID=A0AAV7J3P7_COTGL|nr:hypothetical protein KQX54_012150 [Cotesia glomerata]
MMLVRLVLTTTLFLLVLGIRNSTSQLRDELVATTKDRQAVDKEKEKDSIPSGGSREIELVMEYRGLVVCSESI